MHERDSREPGITTQWGTRAGRSSVLTPCGGGLGEIGDELCGGVQRYVSVIVKTREEKIDVQPQHATQIPYDWLGNHTP